MGRDLVEIERAAGLAIVRLCRPEASNAVNVAMANAICEAMSACQDARAIVLTGADPAFCAGLDLRSLDIDLLGDLPRFVDAVAMSDVPIVAAVNGPAVTGGFELALACDLIVASERAAFADTHLRVGVYPGPVLIDLPRRVGMAWAREMSLTGNFVDAATALRIGIANHVVPHEDLLAFAQRLADAIAEQDRGLVKAIRHAWDATAGTPIEQARRIHLEHAAAGGFSGVMGSDIAGHRDDVLARSRDQRSEGPDDQTNGGA